MAASPGGGRPRRVGLGFRRGGGGGGGGGGADEYERVFEGFVRLSWSRRIGALSWAGGPIVMSVSFGPMG
jgi:hypothetical protein